MWFAFSTFYGRIENAIGYLPRFYYHNKAHIAITESGRRNTHHEAPKYSCNWVTDTNFLEKIESKTGELIGCYGKTMANDDVSRISKRKLFQQFLNIKQKLLSINGTTDKKKTYQEEKAMAADFQVRSVEYCAREMM